MVNEITPEQKRRIFESLYRENAPQVRRWLRRITRHSEEIEDLLQETFAAAFASFSTYRGDAKASTWLYTIMLRTAARRMDQRRRFEVARHLEDDSRSFTSSAFLHPDHDIRQRLIVALERLPEVQRLAFILFELGGFSADEVGARIGRKPNNVGVILYRARRALATSLQEETSHGTPPTVSSQNAASLAEQPIHHRASNAADLRH